MTRLPHPSLLLLLLAGFLVAASPAPAQAPDGALAWTQCHDATVASFINVTVLGSDSLPVILRHEAVHRRQQADAIARTGHCIEYTKWPQLLTDEVEAYCASDSVAVSMLKRDPIEVSAQTLFRLMRQFQRTLPLVFVGEAWARGCPGVPHP